MICARPTLLTLAWASGRVLMSHPGKNHPHKQSICADSGAWSLMKSWPVSLNVINEGQLHITIHSFHACLTRICLFLIPSRQALVNLFVPC